MRVVFLLAAGVAAAGCDSSSEDPTFVPNGGSFEVPGCGYTITTGIGAEAPRASGKTIGDDPTPRFVHLGIVGDPQTSVVAQWRTADETTTAGVIRWGTSPDQLDHVVAGVQFGYRSTGMQVYRQHQAHLCGLSAGTTYSYQVGAKDSHGTEHFSPVYTFHTAPDVAAHPDAEVVFGFVGDSRGGYDVWGQVAQQLAARTPDLMLFSGDAVTVGLDQSDWDDFLGKTESLFPTVPVVMANGNHELNAVNLYAQFAMPGDQQSFGFDYGFAHVFVANDNPDDASAITGAIKTAMDADFAAHASARWKLVMHHQPTYSSGMRHGSNLTLRAAWEPVFDARGVDLVLNGHEHQYEVSKPVSAGAVQASSANAPVYVVAGGAGAELYPFGTIGDFSAYTEPTHSAAVIHVRRDQLTLDSFHPDGTPISTGFAKTKL